MDLKDMSLEQLWKLFPITLVPHNPEWKIWADDEIQSLSELLKSYAPVISHIGSTAVPSIIAKPIVDILVEISNGCDWIEVRNILEDGYTEAKTDFINRILTSTKRNDPD